MRKVGAVLFPGFELLDMFGPLEMFGLRKDDFEIVMLAEAAGPVASGQGPRAVADFALADAPECDILLVPGGPGTRPEVLNPALLTWLAKAAERAERVASVCTGSALLARAGLLDGRKATTNKLAFDWVARQGPQVDWQRSARWVADGKFVTSSGVSAGTDMALWLIGDLLGAEAARETALWAEHEWNDDPAHDPFARPETPKMET